MEKPSGVGIQDHWMKTVLEPQAYGGKPSNDKSDGRSVKREREKSSDCYTEPVPIGTVVAVVEGTPAHFACDICDQTFNTVEYLVLHKKFHTGENVPKQTDGQHDNTIYVTQGGKKRRRYKCELCDVKVNSQYHLDIHRSKHEGAAANKYACGICERSFVAAQFLKSHMMTHTATSITCEVCGVGFTGQAYLKLHMQLHSEVKKFKCGKCDEWFPTKGCIKLHSKKHSKVKNFKCDYCGKQFVSKITMGKHRATHEARPVDCHVQCSQCDRTMHASLLRTHIARAHTTPPGRDDDIKRPHKCDTCGKNFIVKINLDLHIRVCHPDLARDEDEDDSNTDE